MPTKLTPIPFTDVTFADSFWAPRIETNRAATLPAEYDMCRTTGRLHSFEWQPGQPNEPHWFWDSDVAKWIEAASYALATQRDATIEAEIDQYVASMARAQLPDGYVNSRFVKVEPSRRWTNLREAHEMYCAGHMIEAAVAHFQATGQRNLLDVMRRYADHIDAEFGPRPGQRRGYDGHEEIELALVKLYRATNERRYLELAKFFVDERGRGHSVLLPDRAGEPYEHYYDIEAKARNTDPKDFWAKTYDYLQAHKPVREQTEVVGHAVRAMYLFSAMADLAGETNDDTLLRACETLWNHLTLKRMYVTGGIGSEGAHEGFTSDYDLPDDTAYCETCAAIGLIFWAHRMLQLTGDGRYADVMERALYNGALAGISLDGKSFFYVNPLASKGEWQRQAWWDCACCPPNIARLLANLSGYAYSTSDDAVWAHLYAEGRASVNLKDLRFEIEATTCYPWDGAVSLKLKLPRAATFALNLRVPDWCDHYRVAVNDAPASETLVRGYLSITREWQPGDTVTLNLAMPVKFVYANLNVRQTQDQAAIQRGPLVYCLEGADNDAPLDHVVLPDNPNAFKVSHDHDLLGGVSILRADASALDDVEWGEALYRAAPPARKPARLTAIPYYAWANRGARAMRVWLRV